jgi:hypothetical protein
MWHHMAQPSEFQVYNEITPPTLRAPEVIIKDQWSTFGHLDAWNVSHFPIFKFRSLTGLIFRYSSLSLVALCSNTNIIRNMPSTKRRHIWGTAL